MKFIKLFPYILVLLLSLIAILPLLTNGFFPMHDNTQVARVYAMEKSLLDGVFPVRWVSDLGYGYGYPIFNFYGPLPYYIGALTSLIGLNSLLATKMMFVIGILFSGISMYIFSSRFFGKGSGILGSVAYMYFPYHAVNIYIRGAVGEFFAYAFLPLLFYGLSKIYSSAYEKKSISLTDFLVCAFSLSFVVISHTVSLIMLSLIIPLFFIFSIISLKEKIYFSKIFFSALILGAIVASFFILPAFFEKGFTDVDSQVGGGADFNDHFVCIGQLFNSQWGFGGSVPGCIDGMSFMLGKINILLVVISSTIFFILTVRNTVDRLAKRIFLLSFGLLCISIFFQLIESKFIWDAFSYAEYIQYPWRFQNFTALFMSFVIGFIPYSINKLFKTKQFITNTIFVLSILIFNSKYFQPQANLSVNDEFYTNNKALHYTTSKISDEYLPKDFKKPNSYSDVKNNLVFIKNGSFEIVENKTQKLVFNYSNVSGNPIIIYRTFFPGWEASINGEKVKIEKFENSFIQFNTSDSNGIVELRLKQTPIQTISNILTLIAIVVIIAVIILKPLNIKAQRFLKNE